MDRHSSMAGGPRRSRFSNLDPRHRPHDARTVLRWAVWDRVLGRRRIDPPGPPAPRVEPDLEAVRASGGPPRLTWIGHASFLGSANGLHFLVDPVFSARVGRLVPRFLPPGLQAGDLPALDALLITHSHYDHLDRPSVQALPRRVPVVVPLGLGRWFRRLGFERVHELDWWESTRLGRLEIALVPARHWSRRHLADTNRTLWGGFVVDAGNARFYHSGDSAWFDTFAEIGRRFPGILAAMLPIGAYAPAWFMEHHHLNPEQAGRAFLDLGARQFVPMHWGTFKLTDESLCEPVERLRAWWAEHGPDDGRRLRIPVVGETMVLDD